MRSVPVQQMLNVAPALDIGSGVGELTIPLALMGAKEVYAIEI